MSGNSQKKMNEIGKLMKQTSAVRGKKLDIKRKMGLVGKETSLKGNDEMNQILMR